MEEPILLGIDYSVMSRELIEVLVEDASGPDIFNEIANANHHRSEVLSLLLRNPYTPDDVKKNIAESLKLPAVQAKEVVSAEKWRDSREIRHESLTMKIQTLSVSDRVKLALKGGREIRGILARDPNKEVALSILENGKITESEIEMMAKNRSALEEVLRRISKNREWMKNYAVVHALVTNPKTPPGISVSHVSDLKTRDLIILEKNKNVTEAVRSATKKLLSVRKPK